MPRPGWDVINRDAPIPPQIPTDVGVWFAVGGTEKGPVVPTQITSLTMYEAVFGIRTGGPALYDAVDVFFREGGSKAWISAVPTTPTVFLAGMEGETEYEPTPRPQPQITVGSPDAPAGPEPLDRAELEALTRAELDQMAANKGIEDPGSLPNKDAVIDALMDGGPAVSLTAVTPTQLTGALDKLTASYGPGQVSVPGNTDPAVNSALMQHAYDRNRVALIEGPAAADAATLTTYAAAMRTHVGARYSALFCPLAIVPGVATGTTRSVGWSSVEAGIIARNDSHGLSPNVAAAGVNGVSSFSLDVEKRFTDTEYTSLNAASVNMAQYRWGALETFGYRTLVDTAQVPQWWSFGNARLRMGIAADAGAIAETYVFSQIDGRGLTIAAFGGDLRGMLVPYYEAGSLFGATAEEAFQVNVGPAVNTPTTIANGELHAVIMVRMSPFAEWVVIEITKVATTQAIAA